MSGSEEAEARALAQLALALDPRTPPPELKARLLERARGDDRYLPFTTVLAQEMDLAPARMRELLRAAAGEEGWLTGLLPGFALIHFQTGPAVVDRHAGFARLPAGFEIPLHRHRVEELTFVMQGLVVQDDGALTGAGELLRMAPGSVHGLSVIEDAVVASLVGRVDPISGPDAPNA